jgi:hypothetical protein
MSWAAVIVAGGALVGGAVSAKGSKDAAKTAAGGFDEEVEFQRESRDLARGDQAPYREAGTTALDALMSMTGLGGGQSARGPSGSGPRPPRMPGGGGHAARRGGGYGSSYGNQRRFSTISKDDGGPTESNTVYNVHETGNENVYSGGSYTRGSGPATIDGQTGYVEPNIEGRDEGGVIGGAYDDRVRVPPGPWNPAGGGGRGGRRGGRGGGEIPPTGTPPATTPPSQSQPPNPGGFPDENPGGVEGGYNFQTDPGYQFRFEEGQRAIDRSNSASGHSLSGGAVREAVRYGQGMASNEYGNVYNRIANIAGLGQVATNASGGYAMAAGQGMGNAASNGANATAYGQVGSANAWANAGNQIAQLPWGDMFGGSGNGGTLTQNNNVGTGPG